MEPPQVSYFRGLFHRAEREHRRVGRIALPEDARAGLPVGGALGKRLAIVCDYLGFEGINTHRFRKWYATEIYNANGYEYALAQRLLQHNSAAVTQRYIALSRRESKRRLQGMPFSAHRNDRFRKATVIPRPSRRNRKRNSW